MTLTTHPPSRAEVKERVELHLYSPSGPSWPLLAQPLPFFLFTQSKNQNMDLHNKKPCADHYISTFRPDIPTLSCQTDDELPPDKAVPNVQVLIQERYGNYRAPGMSLGELR
jgi:hypothetical protein